MTNLETLKAARKLITPKKNWTRGSIARNGATGRPVKVGSSLATCWCMEGAIRKVNPYCAFNLLVRETGMPTPFIFNDQHTHPEVLAAFDEAIAKLEVK